MNFIPENQRLDFLEMMEQADHDCRTTGLIAVLIAPCANHQFVRESVLTVGELPASPILDRVIRQSLAALQNHSTGGRHA